LTDTVVQRIAFPVIGGAAGSARSTGADVRGHAAGYAAGLRAAEAETAALRARLEAEHAARVAALQADTARRVAVLDAATGALLSQVAPVLRDAEESVVAAALELAEAVLGHAVRASRPGPDATAGLEARPDAGAEATVRRALASVDASVALAVRVSPADAARVAGLDLAVPVVADPSLVDGDAVVDLPDGLLDARIATALDRARTALGVVR